MEERNRSADVDVGSMLIQGMNEALEIADSLPLPREKLCIYYNKDGTCKDGRNCGHCIVSPLRRTCGCNGNCGDVNDPDKREFDMRLMHHEAPECY